MAYYVFLRKHLEEGVYQVSAVSASDVLKRNTGTIHKSGCKGLGTDTYFYIKGIETT